MIPAELEGQIDIWSCGLFVLLVLHCFALEMDYKKGCRDSMKDKMKGSCLTFEITVCPFVFSIELSVDTNFLKGLERQQPLSKSPQHHPLKSLMMRTQMKVGLSDQYYR